jgi:NAD(P)-dependent dehydrogenase (short-subunit alcohol dehydrogenase family)
MHPKPVSTHIPTEDISSGRKAQRQTRRHHSGLGRAITILFAMEGASSLIIYLPEEEKDAEETKKKVQEHGCECHLLATDICKKENCKTVVEVALCKLGGIDILVNNAAYQNMIRHCTLVRVSEYFFWF